MAKLTITTEQVQADIFAALDADIRDAYGATGDPPAGALTAAIAAEHWGIESRAAHERLKRLVDDGLWDTAKYKRVRWYWKKT